MYHAHTDNVILSQRVSVKVTVIHHLRTTNVCTYPKTTLSILAERLESAAHWRSNQQICVATLPPFLKISHVMLLPNNTKSFKVYCFILMLF